MKYMMLIYGAENSWTDAEREECMIESLGIGDQLAAKGKFIGCSPLEPVSTAVSVRRRNGQTLVTDGPFAETTEQLGGYYLLELADLDEAIAVAASLPPAKKGTVEIRPLFDLDGLPPSRPIPIGNSDPAGIPYLLMCYDDEAAWAAAGPNAQTDAMAVAAKLAHRVSEVGQYLAASPLHPAATATCVRVRDGKRSITDGPFAETHEVLGGFYLVLAKSREEAVEIAAQHPGLRFGGVEVRPLFDVSQVRELVPTTV